MGGVPLGALLELLLTVVSDVPEQSKEKLNAVLPVANFTVILIALVMMTG